MAEVVISAVHHQKPIPAVHRTTLGNLTDDSMSSYLEAKIPNVPCGFFRQNMILNT